MKTLADGTQVVSRIYYYLLDFSVSPIKESWNREEVIKLTKKALVIGADNPSMTNSDCSKWIEENLIY